MKLFQTLIYSRRTFYWAFEQWCALMVPHIPDEEGLRYDDVDIEDLAYWFWKHLNDDWDTSQTVLPDLTEGT